MGLPQDHQKRSAKAGFIRMQVASAEIDKNREQSQHQRLEKDDPVILISGNQMQTGQKGDIKRTGRDLVSLEAHPGGGSPGIVSVKGAVGKGISLKIRCPNGGGEETVLIRDGGPYSDCAQPDQERQQAFEPVRNTLRGEFIQTEPEQTRA